MTVFSLPRLLAATMLLTSPMLHSTQVVAHRGACSESPENTVASAKLAWEQGADMVELDIYLTKDKKIAVIHDSSTKRTTGVDGAVKEMNLDELQQLDAGKLRGAQFAGEKIPSLEEMIATLPPTKKLVIEIKVGPEIVPFLKAILEGSGKSMDQFEIISFKYDSIVAAKQALPACRVLWLASYDPKKSDIDDLIQRSHEGKIDGLDLHYSWPIDEDFVNKIKTENLLLYTWTVNDAEIAQRQIDLGVDAITTDRPGWLRDQIKK